MTDKEQRIHDLAIAAASISVNYNTIEIDNENTPIDKRHKIAELLFDDYCEYLNFFEKSIETTRFQ